MRSVLLWVLWVWVVGFHLTGCAGEKEYYEERGSIFHTVYSIKYEGERSLREEIDSTFAVLNSSFNPFLPSSCISRINRNETEVADSHLWHILWRSETISRLSEGMFDITSAPLINLWGFGYAEHARVTRESIDSILKFVGYEKLHLSTGGRIRKSDPRIELNCSAIAKGYAADVIGSLLRSEGVENYMVEIGGEIAVAGVNGNQEAWRIGIRKPSEDMGEQGIEEVFEVSECCGIATSGDYLNYYRRGGKKVGHTINPKTGYPAGSDILSATVLASDALTADALATTFNALGLSKSLVLAEKLVAESETVMGYFFIYADSSGVHRSCRGGFLR
ncbi:MAG: FAD:protein FMN transferase [Tannerellaceae bacterium]|jgi:thiamine biosynthesis lipoprotein|nr:FAD:protein FMN transferase [Tannerellaceae bacterium]